MKYYYEDLAQEIQKGDATVPAIGDFKNRLMSLQPVHDDTSALCVRNAW
jgi:hypothetical protein